ncbi:hypothetical protein [Xanthocytophaga flava]|uniref:hypothetical protein n=1 Tax=Xanthocytophaga flava TaxID=3048013 RepID=UPI0028D83915|nr:hypothetical protein [Xanthocytophaga flavus]MDJ1468176.1 hypothetical protein [Xanthocytophaga flavus]
MAVPQTPLNRQQLKDFAAARFVDNVMEAITPEDARDVVFSIIDSTGTLLDELGNKADLENGKLKLSQLPISASDLAGIPVWINTTIYGIGKQVTYQEKIWQSKINNNQNIPPSEGSAWKEISGSHIQNTDTQLQLPDGSVLTALYILQQLQAKIGIELINQPNGVLGLDETGLLDKSVLKNILDDLADSGNDVGWSIDQIKLYLEERLSSVTTINRAPVATIAARNALIASATPPLQDGESIWVTDATGDPTVTSGWAIYRYFQSGSTWEKVIEKESLDIDLSAYLTKVNAAAQGDYSPSAPADATAIGITLTSGIAKIAHVLDKILAKVKTLITSGDGSKYLADDGTYKTITSDPTMGGQVTGTASNATLLNSAVIGKLLTGLGSVSGTLLATDSIILGFSKVAYFITNIAATIRNTALTGLDTTLSGPIVATDTVLQQAGKTQKQFNDLAEELKIEFLPTVLTANILYTKKITFSSVASSNINSATISYKVNGGTARTALADVNTDIQATSGNYTLTITVALTSSTSSGLLNLTGKY